MDDRVFNGIRLEGLPLHYRPLKQVRITRASWFDAGGANTLN
jgi:serine/threonine protein kinase